METVIMTIIFEWEQPSRSKGPICTSRFLGINS